MRPKQNVSAKHKRIAVGREPKTQSLLRTEVLNACQLAITDGMRRPVSGQDAIRSQVIDALDAQTDKGDRQ